MMFRSAQADDDSESDWDELTPHATPRSPSRQDPNALQPSSLLNTPTETVQSHQSNQSPFLSHSNSSHRQHHIHAHTTHNPHQPHETHDSSQFQIARTHSPHPPPTSHRSQEHMVQTERSSSRHNQHSHRQKAHTGTPHKVHTSTPHSLPHQATNPFQDIPEVAYDASPRPPRTLPPIDKSQSASATVPTATSPLTPATMNPVFEEQRLIHSTTPNQRNDEPPRPIQQENSLVLEFATVSGESARLLLPAQSPPPYSYMGGIAERSEKTAKRCTEEVVSCMRIISDFIITFILGLLHFLCFHISRKLFCGTLHILSDTITKPLIDLCFNELLWPLNACLYQLSKALVLILTPIVELIGSLLGHVTNMLRAFRLVDLHFNNTHTKPMNV